MPTQNSYASPVGTARLIAPELLPVLDEIPTLELNNESLLVMRAGLQALLQNQSTPSVSDAVRREERYVPGPVGAPDVRVLIYTPTRGESARPAYLHLHGGGFVMGMPEINDSANRAMAADLDCAVVSVAYRLAPETRFPGAVEDAYAALAWLHANAEALGVDPMRIAIGGESAGAGHVASLALLTRKHGKVPLRLQLLDAPMIDDRTGSTSEPHPYCGEFVWPPANNRCGWRALLGMEPGGADVPMEAVPARVQDLRGLPPTFIVVGAVDLFFEDSLEYARRLVRAGVPTELHVIPGAFHGFAAGSLGAEVPQIKAYRSWCRDALARAFA